MRIRGAALAIAVVASAGAAAADPVTSPNVVRADAIFAEAQKLLDAGDLDGACAKFEASLELNNQAIGTLLNVARCDARLGKLARAVALYTEARDRGREQNLPIYVATADDQLAKLSPLVPHLAIAFVEQPPDLKIVIDNKAFTVDQAADLPLDPGGHQVTITAPGRVPYDQWIKLAKSEHKAISVPPLAYPTTTHTTRSSTRLIGKLAVSGGGVLFGTGVILGIVAKGRYDDARTHHCDAGAVCDPTGFAQTQSARSLGTVGTALGATGLVVAAVGVVLWVRAPSDHTERGVAIVPVVSPGEAGVVAVGHF